MSKRYPGVRALTDVSLDIYAGKVLALAGENGAGKSTLIKSLAGAVRPDEGVVEIGGRPVAADPGEVIKAGVSVIYQELTDIPDMSVADNLLLGAMPASAGMIHRAQAEHTSRKAMARVGLAYVDPRRTVSSLTLSERQLLEIARCLARDAKVLIFDEPTSSLPESEVEILMNVIKGLKADGLGILYVSHHLDEFFEIADDILVLRDGQVVEQRPTAEWDEQQLVRAMLARDLGRAYPYRERELGDEVLEAEGLNAPRVRDAKIHVRSGEVVGLIGLAGAGRTELMRAIAGVDRPDSGTVKIYGKPVPTGSIAAARGAGIAYVTEDRKQSGLVLEGSVRDNMALGNYGLFSRFGWIRQTKLARLCKQWIADFEVKTAGMNGAVGRLSGGNQQKVVLARYAATEPRLILLDDPTRGVDVGSKAAIYEKVFEMAEGGAGVIVTSSDTDEVLAVCDRAYVLRAGRIVGEVDRSSFDREAALHLASLG
ncbi:sugar ABC transporter ATP-binding protein [Leucobacter tenebrionis]|uniref:sugar ABC transporter ATP-binding protein n=1 Tax=Leucobacter tenebrionis TaxID=2873270 RepID=UPI001CA696E0|nr:sugar ABC transporter ATP-binding protein [Leucobacter tenebrionis]QZY50785.1 sugar ABC transporter ATP-binding protein [Leucobacter tenebrionis]